jgi:hypothetical protein
MQVFGVNAQEAGCPDGAAVGFVQLNLRVSVEFKRRLIEEPRTEKRSVTNHIEAIITELWSQKAPRTIRTKTGKGE